MRLIETISIALLIIASESHAQSDFFVPSGPHNVGTRVVRADLESGEKNGGRPVTFQLWYPSDRASRPRSPYFADEGILDALISEEYYFQSPQILQGWQALTVPAQVDGTPTKTSEGYPVVLLSPGLGLVRHSYTRMALDLASWGYVVACVDHVFNGPMRNAAGEIISTRDAPDAASPDYDRITVERANDLRAILALLEGQSEQEGGPLSGVVDLARVGVLGHSLGGAVAFEACATQARVSACINMDGGPQGTFPDIGIGKPALFLSSDPQYSDAELRAKGRDPATWREKGHELRHAWSEIFDLHPGIRSHYLRVRGTGHLSFTDAPEVMPDTITRFGGNLTDFGVATETISTLIKSFFDAYLMGEGTFPPQSLLDDGVVY